MSRFYGTTTAIGSSSYGGYLNAPILGPMSTNQYPCILPYHSYGSLPGIRPTPPQFFPSQEPNNSDYSVMPRHQYLRTARSRGKELAERELAILTNPLKSHCYSTGRARPVSRHMNYISPQPSSMYTGTRKAMAVGKMNYKVRLPPESFLSTKNANRATLKTAVQRVRSGGCVAPRKKGAIENRTLINPRICAWGALPRSTY